MTNQTPQEVVVKDDPTKVSKPSVGDPTRITKKPRSEKQQEQSRRLGQTSKERKEERLAEIEKEKKRKEEEEKRREEEESATSAPAHEEATEQEVSEYSTLLLGGSLVAVLGVLFAIWYFFLREGENAPVSGKSLPPVEEEVDSD